MPEPGTTTAVPALAGERVALVQLVNRVLDRGVVVTGDVTISVADVDLLYLGLRLVLSSTERLPARSPADGPAASPLLSDRTDREVEP